MRSSGLFFVAALILAGAVAGCSETKTQETATETGKSTSNPEQPGRGEFAMQPTGVGLPIAGNPGASNPGIPQKTDENRSPTVYDLSKPELEAQIAKLSAYQGGDTSTPELGLAHFLQALKRRDAIAVEQLLTSVARIEAQRSKHSIKLAENPPFSAQAKFKFGQLEFVDETKTGARIPVVITDYDGQDEFTEEIIWVLGKDDRGWRVAGYAFELFKNEPWLVLNFQDLEDVRQKTLKAEAEMRRREEQQALEARRQRNSNENPSFQPQR